MPDNLPDKAPEEEVESYYDAIRADVETAVYTYATLEEVDTALYGKQVQNQIKKAKENCIVIMCKGLEMLKDGYSDE